MGVSKLVDFPFILFAVSLVALWLSAQVGDFLRKTVRPLKEEDEREDFSTVLSAALTLLALILAFSFSMAITRYDLRKNYEEAEANAIGTAYVRAELLPAPEAAKVQELLRRYLDQRVLFYRTPDEPHLRQLARIPHACRPSSGPPFAWLRRRSQHPRWLLRYPA
jgi:hypothetical protein